MRRVARASGWIFLSMLVLAACTSGRFYEGEARPRDQIAIITAGGSAFSGKFVIEAVDGKEQRVDSAEVLPGYHSIRVSSTKPGYIWMPGGFVAQEYDKNKFTLSVRAQAGHTYRVGWSEGESPFPVITDVADD